jgi:hypothetical protein
MWEEEWKKKRTGVIVFEPERYFDIFDRIHFLFAGKKYAVQNWFQWWHFQKYFHFLDIGFRFGADSSKTEGEQKKKRMSQTVEEELE